MGGITRLPRKPDLDVDEGERRYRCGRAGVWRMLSQMSWLLAQGHPTREVAAAPGYRPSWIAEIVRRYHARGPAGVGARRQGPTAA